MAEGKWDSSWSLSYDGDFLYKDKAEEDYCHSLIALPYETDPDSNHVHIKTKRTHVLDEDHLKQNSIICSWKVDGVRKINRREFIAKINSVTSLNIIY